MESENIETLEEIIIPVKKPRTQKQIDAFSKVIAKREENRKERKTENEIIDQERKRVLDQKILKKAISLEKKLKKQEKVLDIDDDVIEKNQVYLEIQKEVNPRIVNPKLVIKFI